MSRKHGRKWTRKTGRSDTGKSEFEENSRTGVFHSLDIADDLQPKSIWPQSYGWQLNFDCFGLIFNNKPQRSPKKKIFQTSHENWSILPYPPTLDLKNWADRHRKFEIRRKILHLLDITDHLQPRPIWTQSNGWQTNLTFELFNNKPQWSTK